MVHFATFVMALLWSGFAVIGLDAPLWGAFHWFGLLGVGVTWCSMLALAAILD